MNAIPYASAAGRAKAVIVSLGCLIGLEVLGAALEYPLNGPLNAAERGADVPESTILLCAGALLLYGLAYLLAFVIAVVTVCMWTHRAHRNLRALSAQNLKFTPAWAVGWYFVPFMNLVKPHQAMTELWRHSDPTTAVAAGNPPKKTPSPSLINGWWGLWLVSNFLGNMSFRLSNSDAPAAASASSVAAIAGAILSIGAAIALIAMIRRITRWQDDRVVSAAAQGHVWHDAGCFSQAA